MNNARPTTCPRCSEASIYWLDMGPVKVPVDAKPNRAAGTLTVDLIRHECREVDPEVLEHLRARQFARLYTDHRATCPALTGHDTPADPVGASA